ncbi:MAG: 3-phosphoshikimate 1-carboxyvinyltransferase [Hyphobacterium sp.]|nr:MAG: 3-phosphoshikimate 1-carboxyvinyltransferase [Hyphobacterium sp.]
MTSLPHPSRQAAFSQRRNSLRGHIFAPGDKSISHRALILASLAAGESRINGLLESGDVLATLEAIRKLGATVRADGTAEYRVTGTSGQFSHPATDLDFGNSGTGARLMMGAVAGAGANARFIGDASLSSRPMARITDPLSRMGARCETGTGRLPVVLTAASLIGIDETPLIASAQVKSAILLAGLGAQGETIVRENRLTRDHTETMLKLFGAEIRVIASSPGRVVHLPGPQTLTACDIVVPGDPSSAAFASVAALIIPDSDITLRNVMTNPARFGLYAVLKRMGADLLVTPTGHAAGEAIADIRVQSGALEAIDLEPDIAATMIDEYPVLAVACAFANGTSRLRGLAELRAKESDRLAATCALLSANGVSVRIDEDDLIIEGGKVPGGGHVATHEDHRIAMSALVMGLASNEAVTIDDINMIATSYPGFIADMTALGAVIEVGA